MLTVRIKRPPRPVAATADLGGVGRAVLRLRQVQVEVQPCLPAAGGLCPSEDQAVSPRLKSLLNSSTVAGGTPTRRALARTCSGCDIPTSAVVIPGEHRTNCKARSASHCNPRASATKAGRLRATWPWKSEALAISVIPSSLAASITVFTLPATVWLPR